MAPTHFSFEDPTKDEIKYLSSPFKSQACDDGIAGLAFCIYLSIVDFTKIS